MGTQAVTRNDSDNQSIFLTLFFYLFPHDEAGGDSVWARLPNIVVR